ncbi:MAG: carbonic anhydrase family protein [Collimonas sp.]|uniref:carbonic anhydrase n=1 Tax=Collimonas sp. TaxID=1963772 RepID=UPI00326625B6
MKNTPSTRNLTVLATLLCTALSAAVPVAAYAGEPAAAAHAHGFDYAHQKEWRLESGASQSPIDIHTKELIAAERTPDENDAITLHIATGGANVIDNGHTVQIVPQSSSATIRGRHFTLAQAHFHAPAEHTIDGKRYPLEGHFVFKAQDGRLAVVAVLYQEGAENFQFDAIVRGAIRDQTVALEKFDAAPLLPADTQPYYHYLGSLTTPPLTENVEWYVLAQPVELSADDIDAFKKLYAHNARDPQPLDGRSVLKYEE